VHIIEDMNMVSWQKVLKVVFLTGRPTWTQLSMFTKVAADKAGRTVTFVNAECYAGEENY